MGIDQRANHPRSHDMEIDVLKDCVDSALYDIKRFFDPPQYESEVEYSRAHFNNFCDRKSLKRYRADLIAYFDRRVLEVLADEV